MRKAAGILLIVLGIVDVVDVIIRIRNLSFHAGLLNLWPFVFLPMVFAALFIAGGVLCLRKKYWGVCLTSALFALVNWINVAGAQLMSSGSVDMSWQSWILLVVGLISTVLVCVKRKEWQEISDSVDGKVSYGG